MTAWDGRPVMVVNVNGAALSNGRETPTHNK